MEEVFELLMVTFATLWLVLSFLYYTIGPTVLNLLLATAAVIWLQTRYNRTLINWVGFVTVSLGLTFVTRAPDFVEDALTGIGLEQQIAAAVTLQQGDTVHVSSSTPVLQHRHSYFETAGYVNNGGSGKVGGPAFYLETIHDNLLLRGLRLDFSEPDTDSTTIDINLTPSVRDQQYRIEVSNRGQRTAWMTHRERLHFRDEFSDATLSLHLQHLFKNTAWNWLLRIRGAPTFRPVNQFLESALIVRPPDTRLAPTTLIPELRTLSLHNLNMRAFQESVSLKFDCVTEAAQVAVNGPSLSIITPLYRLRTTLPAQDETALGAALWIRRISCGSSGYAAWLGGNGPGQRLVLSDRHWRPVMLLDFPLDALTGEDRKRLHVLNFGQVDETFRLEVLVENLDKPGAPMTAVQLTLTTKLGGKDYGSKARVWPGVF